MVCHEFGVGEIPKWLNRAAHAGAKIANRASIIASKFRKNRPDSDSEEDAGSE